MRGIKARRVDYGQIKLRRDDFVLVGGNPEFARLFDGIGKVSSAVRQHDDVSARRLRGEKVRAEVRSIERMTHRAQHGPASGFHKVGEIFLEAMAEGVIDGNEEPFLSPLTDDAFDQCIGTSIGIPRPMNRVGRAFGSRQISRADARRDHDAVILLCEVYSPQCYRRIGEVKYRINVVDFIPMPQDVQADVGLVLVIPEHKLDRTAIDLASELLDRHLRGLDGPVAGQIREHTRHVGQHTDFNRAGLISCPRTARHDASQHADKLCNSFHLDPLPQSFFVRSMTRSSTYCISRRSIFSVWVRGIAATRSTNRGSM